MKRHIFHLIGHDKTSKADLVSLGDECLAKLELVRISEMSRVLLTASSWPDALLLGKECPIGAVQNIQAKVAVAAAKILHSTWHHFLDFL